MTLVCPCAGALLAFLCLPGDGVLFPCAQKQFGEEVTSHFLLFHGLDESQQVMCSQLHIRVLTLLYAVSGLFNLQMEG